MNTDSSGQPDIFIYLHFNSFPQTAFGLFFPQHTTRCSLKWNTMRARCDHIFSFVKSHLSAHLNMSVLHQVLQISPLLLLKRLMRPSPFILKKQLDNRPV